MPWPLRIRPWRNSSDPVVHGDWTLACDDGPACVLRQSNGEGDTGNIRMRSEVAILADGRVLLSVTVPALVLLTEGPWLTVDGVFIAELTYLTCRVGLHRAADQPPRPVR